MNQIENLIYSALNNADSNELRTQAENQIYLLVQNNQTDFFLTLSNIIADQQKSIGTRQSAATVFKRLITFTDQQNVFFWDRVTMNAKMSIKQMLLSTLISSEVVVVKAGANAIAQIASIQIPRKQWLDILITLAQNTNYQDFNIRRASVITLGYICQQLKSTKSNIDEDSCKQILGSLLMGLDKQGQIVQLSLCAIRDSIQFLKGILQHEEYCNKTFQCIMPFLNNQQTRPKIYEIMFEFAKHCYFLLNNYLNLVINFTVAHMQLRNQSSSLAMTLWDTVGNEYLQRISDLHERIDLNQKNIPNYVMIASPQILSEIMALMLINSKKQLDMPQLREGAVQTLTTIVECGDLQIVNKITNGVATVLKSSNPWQRQATVLLFGCLCNYPDRFQIQKNFKDGFNFFYKLLQDNDITVVKNTLNGFVSLSEYFPEVWIKNNEIKDIFLHLLSMSKHNDQDIRVLSLNILLNISEVLSKHPDPIATEPKAYLTELVGMFEGAIQKNVNKETIEKLIIIIMNIIISTTNTAIVNELISHLLQRYHFYSTTNISDKPIVLESIISLIHTCLLAISKSSLPKPQLKDQIFSLIDQQIKIYGIEAEAINMISAASSCYSKDFKSKIDQYWDYIMHALSQVEQKYLFKTTLTCISDIARCHQQFIVDKIMTVFRILVDYMQKNIDRQLKTEILKCFGDLSLGLKKYAESFLDTILEICENCFEAVYTFSEQEAEKSYAEELKQALIEMYHCLVFSVNDQYHCNPKMAAHFPLICTFIVRSCDVKFKPTVDYLRNCLYLIYDCGLFYSTNMQFKPEVYRITESQQIINLVDTIKKYQDRNDVKELILYIEDKLKLRR